MRTLIISVHRPCYHFSSINKRILYAIYCDVPGSLETPPSWHATISIKAHITESSLNINVCTYF